MKLFHLFALSALFLSFSGKPAFGPAKLSRSITSDSTLKAESQDMIPWELDKRLAWDDFLCEPKVGSDAVASTSTSLGIAYQLSSGQLRYHITCYFNKEKSWGLMKTDYILAHEQGHFDITEIFARKLNQALQNYTLNRPTFQKDINTIYEAVVASKEAFQSAYDGETDHSRNKRKQAEWLERINNLLEDTQPYANYP